MSLLFSPIQLRGIALKNRIVMSPMCQYSAVNGVAQPWHAQHLGARAIGGVGLVMVEMTAVSAGGRITPGCLGIWSDAHAEALAPAIEAIKDGGATPGIQIAHAGRKGSRSVPWEGNVPLQVKEGGWALPAPSAIAFAENWGLPTAMSENDIDELVADFADATRRAASAGFEVIEGHFAHGYLLHQFLSPISNQRTDCYGGDLAARASVPLRVAAAMRSAWPENLPLFIRLSVVDWLDGGLTLEDSVQFAIWLRELGVDVIDCSSGAVAPGESPPVGPGYHVPFAAAVRERASIKTAAVGLITDPPQAEKILEDGAADLIFIGRALLRDPYWASKAAEMLDGVSTWPIQYARAVSGGRGRSPW